MWAEGLTPTAASRLWGAPSRRTLAAWEKEALGGGLAVEAPRVPGACRRAKHARYPEETRAEALRLLGLGKPAREIARALGLPSGSVVSRWAAEARRRAKMAPGAYRQARPRRQHGVRDNPLHDAGASSGRGRRAVLGGRQFRGPHRHGAPFLRQVREPQGAEDGIRRAHPAHVRLHREGPAQAPSIADRGIRPKGPRLHVPGQAGRIAPGA